MKKVELINKHKLDIKKNLREAKKVQKEFEKSQCLFYQKKESLADEVEKLKKEVNFVVHFFFFFFSIELFLFVQFERNMYNCCSESEYDDDSE